MNLVERKSPSWRDLVQIGSGWKRRLNNRERWLNNVNRELRISEMDERYLLNCEALLLRNAESILVAVQWADAFDVSPWEAEMREKHGIPLLAEETDGVDPVSWIRQQPVFLAIQAELNARASVRTA